MTLIEGNSSAQTTPSAPALSPSGQRFNFNIQSRDRMFEARVEILPSWTHTSLHIVNLTTKQDLGTYKDVLETMNGAEHSFKVYEHQSDIFSAQDMADAKKDPAVTEQLVTFFKDETNRQQLHLASTFDKVGIIQVQVMRDGKQIAYDEATLTTDPAFSSLIHATDNAISGRAPAPTQNPASR